MDSAHDIGGKQGFGAIVVDAPEFHFDWEARAWALTKTAALFSSPSIDAWRHGIETMEPTTYLTQPYFVKWTLNNAGYAILDGSFTLDEFLQGSADTRGAPAQPLDMQASLARLRGNNIDFRRKLSEPSRFSIGDRVMTNRHGHSGHTRLPAYARAAEGAIVQSHGAYAFADACADGVEAAEYLYSVEFDGQTLWGPEAEPGTSVIIDLWESYLDAV